MQIVIDIPGEKYQGIINNAEEILDASTFCSPRYLYQAVLDGIPIPKGHGRLIDADALNISHGVFVPKVKGNVFGCPMDAVFVDEINDAPTIIKADKAESGDK